VFLANVALRLAELYYTALQIPVTEPESERADGAPFPTDQWAEQYRALREKIGDVDAYWLVFDATKKEEPVQGSLAPDISEIYYDLKAGSATEGTEDRVRGFRLGSSVFVSRALAKACYRRSQDNLRPESG